MGETKAYYSVSEVAEMFDVTPQAVRDWIKTRKLIAIQPASEGGLYRIPVPAVAAMRRVGDGALGSIQANLPEIQEADAETIYAERIRPVLTAVSLGAEEALRSAVAGDPLMAPYPTFPDDYALFAQKMAVAARSRPYPPRSRKARSRR